MNDNPKRYHHGDLRRALIDTALGMLEETDDWRFTLRELARRAGVSHTAAYKHFPDKAGLLAELALLGFERLRTVLLAARPRPPVRPREEFLAMSRAYVRFGADNSNLYRLMFSADARQSAHAQLKDRGAAALDVLVDLISAGQAAGWLRARDIRQQAGAGWSQLHGLTLLTIDGLLGPDTVGTDAVDASLEILLEGLQADSGGTAGGSASSVRERQP
ncbi:MAG TPA: TetR/AcrR family transcriptional regulator [Roseomonas sp.]|jgi:AcrR family transcriptional regulator